MTRARPVGPPEPSDAHPPGPLPGDSTTPPASPALVVLDAVTRVYPADPPVRALEALSLTIERGDEVSLTGRSGSGKSTLLNLLGLLDRPSSGRILFEGGDVSQLDDRARSQLRGRRIGFVFQAYHLLADRSAVENVMLGLLYWGGLRRRERLDLARRALDQVGLSHRAGSTPATMSGGERQRVAIARAIVGQPGLLLCDEPTGNLDSTSADQVLELIHDLSNPNRAVVIVTHDPAVAGRMARQLHLADGHLSGAVGARDADRVETATRSGVADPAGDG